MLDKGQADLSILFTTDAQLAAEADKYVILEDDKEVFPRRATSSSSPTRRRCKEAGPDYEETIEQVQEGLTEEVMQELGARVDIDKQTAAETATQYLQEEGYIE